MNKKTYPVLKTDFIGFILTVISIFITVRLGIFNGFNFGFTISGFALIVTGLIYLSSKECKDKAFCVLLTIGALVLCCSYSVISDGTIKFITFLYLVFIYATLFVTISGNTNAQSGTYSYVLNTVQKSVYSVFDNFMLPFRSVKQSAKGGKSKNVLYLLIGLGISFPILCVILPLLTTSDLAFGNMISNLFEDAFVLIGAIILTVIITPFIFAFLFSMKKKDLAETNVKTIPDKVSKIILNTILSATAVVYLAYLVSQLAYITKAFAFLLPDNYSASEFARSGFFQMGVIAFINFVILFLCATLVKKTESKKIPVSTKSLLIFLCLFTVFYISTAFVKMLKYISLYGLTRLRVLTSIFMLMLAVIFIIILLRLIITRLKYIKAIILVCTITMISISVVDINTVIANYNYNTYKSGKINNIDVEQIGSLGVSGLPVLVKLSEDIDLNEYTDKNFEIITEIDYNAYDIYSSGIYSASDCTEENLVKTSIFAKNYAWKQGKIAVDRFVKNNPEFKFDDFENKYYEDFDEEDYDEYDEDEGWY